MKFPVPPPPQIALRFEPDASQIVGGNALELLVGGDEAYPRMLGAIAAAQKTVWLEVYEFFDDPIGRTFAKALIERAQHGVDVRVSVDALGAALTAGELLDDLRNGGVKVLSAYDLRPWQKAWRWLVRDHRKLLAVDSRVAFTGGMNIGLPYAGAASGGGGWHDLQLEVRGPAVRALSRTFVKRWRKMRGPAIHDPADSPPAGEHAVRVLANHEAQSRKEIKLAYRRAFRAAEKRIVIANAYFLPGPRMLHTLLEAARRGVEIIVVLPGANDHASFQLASRARYPKLIAAGARVFELEGAMLHAKAAVVDGLWTTVGSCNLDAWSLRRNLELNVAVFGPRMAGIVEGHVRGLLPRCREITAQEVRSWSATRRAIQWLCLYFFTLW